MIAIVLTLLVQAPVATGSGVKVRYGADALPKERIYAETKLAIKIEGSDTLANFVRSLHPLLSLEKLVLRAEGTHALSPSMKHRFEYEEARVEARYDDENFEFDYQKGVPPADLQQDKARQMMWFLAAGGRSFTLSPEGAYRSEDPNQDGNGEAMDLFALGITRMPDGPVKAGDTYERSWKGERSEKGKDASYAFKQKVKVESVEAKDGKTRVTLTSDLTGQLEGDKNPAAEENWTRCAGTTRTVIEAETGRIVHAEGQGKVTVYFRNTAETGQKQDLTLTFEAAGKMEAK